MPFDTGQSVQAKVCHISQRSAGLEATSKLCVPATLQFMSQALLLPMRLILLYVLICVRPQVCAPTAFGAVREMQHCLLSQQCFWGSHAAGHVKCVACSTSIMQTNESCSQLLPVCFRHGMMRAVPLA